MNNSNFDPDRIHQRRLIINVSIVAACKSLSSYNNRQTTGFNE